MVLPRGYEEPGVRFTVLDYLSGEISAEELVYLPREVTRDVRVDGKQVMPKRAHVRPTDLWPDACRGYLHVAHPPIISIIRLQDVQTPGAMLRRPSRPTVSLFLAASTSGFSHPLIPSSLQ